MKILKKLKSKFSSKRTASTDIEGPSHPRPTYVEDNPMYPSKVSTNDGEESLGFVMGTAFPKVAKLETKYKPKTIEGRPVKR
jgi:hypothetical protein